MGLRHGDGVALFLGGADFLDVAVALHAGIAFLADGEYILGVRIYRLHSGIRREGFVKPTGKRRGF